MSFQRRPYPYPRHPRINTAVGEPSTSSARDAGVSSLDSPYAANPFEDKRARAALDESSALSYTESALEQYIAQGQAVMESLGNQKEVLRGTKRRLVGVASSLGASRDTIHFIERRTTADFVVFFAGAALTLAAFVAIYYYFG